jgi:hypothetical protein
MSTRVPPHIKVAYERIAKNRGGEWTPSSVLAEAAEEWLEYDMGEKFGARLASQVTQAINTGMAKFENRQAKLLARIAKNTGEEKYILEGVVSPEQVDAAKRLVLKDMKKAEEQ